VVLVAAMDSNPRAKEMTGISIAKAKATEPKAWGNRDPLAGLKKTLRARSLPTLKGPHTNYHLGSPTPEKMGLIGAKPLA